MVGAARGETQGGVGRPEPREQVLQRAVRHSGDIKGSPGSILRGPKGEVKINQGVIIADRHLHITPEDASEFGFKNGDVLQAEIEGDKGGVMSNITVRVSDQYELDLHVDTDDANAFMLMQGQKVFVKKTTE